MRWRALPTIDKGWRLPARFAVVSMTITVALIAAIGMLGGTLGLSLGAAILLGAILAPTDPEIYLPLCSLAHRSAGARAEMM